IGIGDGEEILSQYSEVAAGVNGELYALAENRDALIVLDGTDLRILQVIENNFDGITNLVDPRDISVNTEGPDAGRFVRVRTGEDGIATFARDDNTGRLTLLNTQRVEGSSLVNSQTTVHKVVYDDVNLTAAVHVTVDDTVDVFELVKLYTVDRTTGLLTAVPDLPDGGSGIQHEGELKPRAGETIVDISFGKRTGLVYVLFEDSTSARLIGVQASATQFFTEFAISDDGSLGFTGADRVVGTDNHIHLLSSDENFVVTFAADGTNVTYIQKVTNGTRGVTGLIAPVSVTDSIDGKFAYVASRDADSVVVLNLDGRGAMAQRLSNNSAGVMGLTAPAAITGKTASGAIVAATQGDATNFGQLVTFASIAELGNPTVARGGPLGVGNEKLFILPQPFGESESTIDGWRFLPQAESFQDRSPTDVTPVILERDEATDTWTITGIGRMRRLDAAFGSVQSFSFDLQSGSPTTTNRYFGWYEKHEGFPGGSRSTVDSSVGVGTTLELDLSTGSDISSCRTDLA
ncbi:MAG: lactonase family protein, partial [Pirellulales bacterium]|nr:lactonase family protein [Pirellulales bacterium]